MDEPFSEEEITDASGNTFWRIEIRLRMALTERTASVPPENPALLEFVLDTAADYATVFPDDLSASGIPFAGPSGGFVTLTLMDSSRVQCPMRNVALWLYGNVPGLENQPYRIAPNGGVLILPQPDPNHPDAADLHPLLGMNPLVDAGLKIEINSQTRLFSVWVP
jgi:hypothetical protein